jgi:hypothetical protein
MKISNLTTRFLNPLTISFLAVLWFLSPLNLPAAESTGGPQVFATPQQAVQALQAATAAKDRGAMRKLFGPELDGLLTGDAVQDANNAQRFATALAKGCELVKEGNNRIILEIGDNHWPMPIPLVKLDGQWYFDTSTGKEEIINRHIGKDELTAIGVCRAYVTAQRQYARANLAAGAGLVYAQQFRSTPGKKDGLYWLTGTNEPASPFGPLVASAQAEGYATPTGAGPHPFHGYYFRIITQQGPAARGGEMSYLVHGNLTGGFALMAYPEHWDQSGIMTFIVNQDGQVFQQNFGEETARIATKLQTYNPDSTWTLVQDEGILRAISER